ncbi:putative mitochondrial hypothetical protein [Leptomonas pyrrhocoris]|uniref:Treble clef zinc finger domain-containing protein n=1 Tax=Leptomonas pyrrhocoris TaxID=157538 RepID=A0A0M9G200_LEPPY|nr:putative mitochondrial hypothetical protein [Leptomonas pyrrhocoris]KPA80613.1 putative mitochondrial hypothetical protein [Leptomonas pyrrhocoris]|eukprot:XP_015659052.1 putative mitochondrial hypothetical protein [Leptomonas pyrrhocoris]
MTKRIGRGGSNRRGGLMGEDDNAEDELEGVETPTEDPTAPAHDEDDAEVSRRYRHHGGEDEEDETRVDGAEETENTKGAVANLALEGKDDEPGRKRSASAAARRRAGQGNAGEDGDAEEDEEDTATSSTSNAVGGETTALDTSPHDEEVANKYLSVAFPDLAAEYTAAGPQSNKVPVEEVRIDSAEVAAWRCPVCAKTWSCGVFVRCILKNGCPHCAAEHRTTMSTVRPDLLQLWDYNRNNPFLKPEEIAADSREVAYWTCPTCRETYTARVRDRVQDKTQCPSCALLRSTSADAAGSAASALQLEWHPLKNGDLRIDQLAPTDRKTKVWWLCGSCGHEWEASLGTRLSHSPRSRGRNCPACHGKATAEIL